MTTYPTTDPLDIDCARMIGDDLREASIKALREMISTFRTLHPAVDPRISLIMLTHCDLVDLAEYENRPLDAPPPLTPAALALALVEVDSILT